MNTFVARSLLLALALPAAALAQTPATLDKIKQSGTMTLAYRESSIPFSYLGGDAQPTGFGFEICEKIADKVKVATGRADMKKAYQSVTSANRIPLLQNGTIDIECGSTTYNSERGKQVQFATNYFYTGTRFLVKAGTSVNKLADLAGKPVVSTTGTTNFQIIRRLNEEQKLGIDLLGAKDHAESALLVQSGRAVAFAMDDILLYGLKASSLQPAELAVVGEGPELALAARALQAAAASRWRERRSISSSSASSSRPSSRACSAKQSRSSTCHPPRRSRRCWGVACRRTTWTRCLTCSPP